MVGLVLNEYNDIPYYNEVALVFYHNNVSVGRMKLSYEKCDSMEPVKLAIEKMIEDVDELNGYGKIKKRQEKHMKMFMDSLSDNEKRILMKYD